MKGVQEETKVDISIDSVLCEFLDKVNTDKMFITKKQFIDSQAGYEIASLLFDYNQFKLYFGDEF